MQPNNKRGPAPGQPGGKRPQVPKPPRGTAISARRTGRPLTLLLALAGLLIVAVLGFRIYLGRDAEDRIDEEDVIDFAALAPPKAERFLMCPPGTCNLKPDVDSPVFDIGWETLRSYWSEVIAHQPRVKLIGGDGELQKITYVAHSALLRTPDIITIEFFPMGEHSSSFAIESHSRYPFWDWGDNRARVLAWVQLLKNMTKAAAPT